MTYQPGILEDIPLAARYLFFRLKPGSDPRPCLHALADITNGGDIVIGLGQTLLNAIGASIPGMATMPIFEGKGVATPSTPYALWCWLRGSDRGVLLHKARQVRSVLAPAFTLGRTCDAFKYAASLDLSGYEDGTENPKGEDAIDTLFLQSKNSALAGSSFVAVQIWEHDLDAFQAKTPQAQNDTFGRDRESNEELEDAPESAHVKRTAQESFEPEAFVVRRSMPWSNETQEGLVFVAFGHSFAAFETLLAHMVGADDGIVDGLFSFTQPVTGSYFWCPPVRDGKLNLAALS
ncbi:Dyp-type peroxidase [Candidatus Thiothrix sp. Deng01]|uniref:Dyp-type peroxidase n=1 Tax=Candidatus Thiothrix phosphatis TaxID=3112415 RepID=A0ABU6D2V6_9GAMM|nr:Dyp-type peroxidase [Candidatus Thiothrix sp. Deng01]MEB4593424.1 Dyp-type peroxidase [Candidatus Thiothrix sp. Deng01]